MMKNAFVLIFLTLFAAACSRAPRELITYDTLLENLLDSDQIASLEQPGARVITSYDRTGKNDDFSNFLREGPDGWKVLADLEGPGYVSRFWCTGSKDGTKRLRFYFNGEKNPSIETTLDDFMGTQEPLTLPFAGYEPYCWFSWLPIPFEKRLVIMEQAPVTGEKLYYHIAHHQLSPSQTVANLILPLKASAAAKIAGIKERWNSRRPGPTADITKSISLAPGTRTSVLEMPGPATIRELHFTPEWPGLTSPSAIEKSLRELVVRIYWDGSTAPSVEAPLGALCGSLWTRMRYQSLYFGMTNETLFIKFPMPFASSAKIEIENTGDSTVALNFAAITANTQITGGYFHSGWRKSTPTDVGQPHTIMQTTGRGKYVGCILGVQSMDQSWWVLEGDELIYVDGETEPGWKGTGLEDYFNAGWDYGNAIASPLQGMPYKTHFRNFQYRIHKADPVQFNNAFRMIFERGPDNASKAYFESVSFYYMAQPMGADSEVGKQSVHPEPNPLAQQTLMFEINDRERLGDQKGAKDAAIRYLEQFPESPFKDDLLKRIANYEGSTTMPPGKALLGVYANMPVTVFIDGAPIGRFGNPQAMQFKEIDLAPGRHVIAAQAPRQQYPDWVQIGLKFGDTIIGTDRTWKYSFEQQTGWNKPGFDDSQWPVHGFIWAKGPPEEPFIFCQPHPYIGMTAIPWGIRPPKDWPAGAQQVFYRKVFEVP